MDVIQHLLDIEKEASETAIKVQEEADKKIASARAQADSIFKEKYSSFMKDLDLSVENQKKAIQTQMEEKLASFKAELEATKKDFDGFSQLLDKVISA